MTIAFSPDAPWIGGLNVAWLARLGSPIVLNLRRPEIATALRCSLHQVDGFISSGLLPSHMVGGTRVARIEDVLAFNERLAMAAAAQAQETPAAQAEAARSSPP